MSTHTWVSIISAAVVLLILVMTATHWAARQSFRTLLRGLGWALLVVGLWLSGVLDLSSNAYHALRRWWDAQGGIHNLSLKMTIALGVIALAILFWLIGSFIKPVTRQMAKERRRIERERAGTPATTARPAAGNLPARPAAGNLPARPAAGSSPAQAPASGVSDEDAEVEAILRSRGIK